MQGMKVTWVRGHQGLSLATPLTASTIDSFISMMKVKLAMLNFLTAYDVQHKYYY